MTVPDEPEIAVVDAQKRDRSRSLIHGSIGLLVGVVTMWLVFQFVDIRAAGKAMVTTNGPWLAAAAATFWLGVCTRILRWRCLLVSLTDIKTRQVADALIVGYAMNYLLPARLGEPFRAVYTRKRYGIDAIAVFGSIVTERLLDGLLSVLILVCGLVLAAKTPVSDGLAQFHFIAGIGLTIFGGATAVLLMAARIPVGQLSGSGWFGRLLARFIDGASALGKRDLVVVLIWTVLVWLLEISALWALLVSLGLEVAIYQVLLIMGVGALSTLIPTAPGYVGSLQLAFAAVMAAVALPSAMGVAAATLVQAVFYGSLIVVAILIVAPRWLRTDGEYA